MKLFFQPSTTIEFHLSVDLQVRMPSDTSAQENGDARDDTCRLFVRYAPAAARNEASPSHVRSRSAVFGNVVSGSRLAISSDTLNNQPTEMDLPTMDKLIRLLAFVRDVDRDSVATF